VSSANDKYKYIKLMFYLSQIIYFAHKSSNKK